MSNIEKLLTALLNGEKVDIEPKSRIEQYLKNCCDKCGCDGLPTPTARVDFLLYQLAEQLAGEGGGGGGTEPTPSGENKLAKVIERTVTEITAEDLKGCTKIGSYAFSYCPGLTSVTIRNGVTSISNGAFSGCTGLTSITIPNSVTSIGSEGFRGCTGLKDVYITDVEAWLNISFPEGGYYQYGYPNYYGTLHILDKNGNEVTEVVIPDNVTSIGAYAFHQCKALTSIKFPKNVESIGAYALYNCDSIQYFDFTKCTAVPILASPYAFYHMPSTWEILVPMSLVNEWKAATNWSTWASRIVGV